MTTKEITYPLLEQAIRIAYREDRKIVDFYDSNVVVNSVGDIVTDIVRKIKGFEAPVLRGVYEKNCLIGYFVYQGKMLISFSISVRYRVRKYLREFFGLINKELKKDFVCFLWRRNKRAIRWLEKNGLEAFDYTIDIVKLVSPVKESVNN